MLSRIVVMIMCVLEQSYKIERMLHDCFFLHLCRYQLSSLNLKIILISIVFLPTPWNKLFHACTKYRKHLLKASLI